MVSLGAAVGRLSPVHHDPFQRESAVGGYKARRVRRRESRNLFKTQHGAGTGRASEDTDATYSTAPDLLAASQYCAVVTQLASFLLERRSDFTPSKNVTLGVSVFLRS